ncbi:hypothetical protein BBJ28_00018277 [Nothophytophthora sp. Chile5]|nr:hypothetical protein BBJ28_00018277 [Nothophytophthora sp. Chile5]
MTQAEAALLIRPRTASQVAPVSTRHAGEATAPHTPSPASAQATRPRRWFLRVLLLGGALYASLLLFWSANHLGLLSVSDSSNASSFRSAATDALRETEELQLMRDDFLGAATGSQEDDAKAPKTALAPPVSQDRAAALKETREKLEKKLMEQQTRSPSGLGEEERKAVQLAEEHARSVKMLLSGETKQRELKCIGWRATGGCSPHGPREPENDKGCTNVVPNSASGYCEVEDKATGERFRVMKRYCASLRYDALFRCSEAPDFASFKLDSMEAADKALVSGFALPNVESGGQSRDGIVMVVYPKLVASAYATIRALRDVLGCRLPIEIWFREQEMRAVPEAMASLQQLARGSSTGGAISFHEIDDPWASGFGAKVFAVYHSFFDRVLFLDADNVPVRDPSFLFTSPEFEETGAVFWPDFWHPSYTIFNIHGQSLLWEVLGTPFVNSFEQESGQLLIDRRRHAAPLELVNFYQFHRPNPFTRLKLAYGDKDLFRFAWLKLKTPFHMIQAPPAVAGKVINGTFCGMTMVQHDAEGGVLFLHRNSNKLTGEVKRKAVYPRAEAIKRVRAKLLRQGVDAIPEKQAIDEEMERLSLTPAPTLEPLEPDGLPDPLMWTHLQSFNGTSRRAFYRIKPYRATPEFPEWQRCYGQREPGQNQHFYTQEFADLPFAGLERHLREFAQEAVQLHQRKVDEGRGD